MTLIKSISGIRGTIGGKVDESLTPLDIVKIVTSYAIQRRRMSNLPSNSRRRGDFDANKSCI